MAGDLTYPFGLPITLHYGKANVEPNATTALTLAQGGAGFVVPTGYKFHPILLHAESNAAITTDSATLKVRANTTALTSGPSVVLDDSAQNANDTARVGENPIAAGKVVNVAVTTETNFAPNTADIDAILVGILLPA